MIARLWHGWTKPENADAYEQLLRSQILPGIRSKPGCTGIHLFRRSVGAEVEFVTLLFFESLDAVRAFAGKDYETAVVPPAAQKLLARFETKSAHYQTVAL